MPNTVTDDIISHTLTLRDAVDALSFADPVTHVYNPLGYAWPMHEQWLTRYATGTKRVVFLGMNPGPWGMAQTGVPFGEIAAVRDYLGIDAPVGKPDHEHPKRPIQGLACTRSEVSGRRLWGLVEERYPDPADFFADHAIVNYCPLVFMAESGKNITPDKLPASERGPLDQACDAHLQALVQAWRPQWLVGVGAFAEKCAQRALEGIDLKFGRILHPSPASPIANRGWAPQAEAQMLELGLWEA